MPSAARRPPLDGPKPCGGGSAPASLRPPLRSRSIACRRPPQQFSSLRSRARSRPLHVSAPVASVLPLALSGQLPSDAAVDALSTTGGTDAAFVVAGGAAAASLLLLAVLASSRAADASAQQKRPRAGLRQTSRAKPKARPRVKPAAKMARKTIRLPKTKPRVVTPRAVRAASVRSPKGATPVAKSWWFNLGGQTTRTQSRAAPPRLVRSGAKTLKTKTRAAAPKPTRPVIKPVKTKPKLTITKVPKVSAKTAKIKPKAVAIKLPKPSVKPMKTKPTKASARGAYRTAPPRVAPKVVRTSPTRMKPRSTRTAPKLPKLSVSLPSMAGVGKNPVAVAAGLAVGVVGAAAALFSQVDVIMEVVGLLGVANIVSRRLLFAEDRKETLEEIKELVEDKIAPGEAVDDFKKIAEAVIEPVGGSSSEKPSGGDDKKTAGRTKASGETEEDSTLPTKVVDLMPTETVAKSPELVPTESPPRYESFSGSPQASPGGIDEEVSIDWQPNLEE